MPKKVRFAEISLDKIADKLQRYCHFDDCDNYGTCPQRCYICGDTIDSKLDIDTGIAWLAASDILEFIDNVGDFNDLLYNFNYHRSQYVKYKRLNHVDRDHHFDEMDVTVVDLRDEFGNLQESYYTLCTCRSIVAYHHTKYKKLHTAIDRATDLMSTAFSNASNSLSWCGAIFKNYEESERSAKC